MNTETMNTETDQIYVSPTGNREVWLKGQVPAGHTPLEAWLEQNPESEPVPEIDDVKNTCRKLFTTTFAEIDRRASRPTQDILARSVDIATIVRDLQTLVQEAPGRSELVALKAELEAANATDEYILVELRYAAEENRGLLLQIEAATTWEDAQAIRPWKPWQPWQVGTDQSLAAPAAVA